MFASLIAAGYVLGEEVAESRFAKKLSEGAEMVKQKASAFDDEYKLGDKLRDIGDKLSEKVKKLDESVQLSEKVKKWDESVQKATSSIPSSLSSGLDRLKAVSTQIGDAVKITIESQVRQVEAAIEARRGTTTLGSSGTPLHDIASSTAQSSPTPSSSTDHMLNGGYEDKRNRNSNPETIVKDETAASLESRLDEISSSADVPHDTVLTPSSATTSITDPQTSFKGEASDSPSPSDSNKDENMESATNDLSPRLDSSLSHVEPLLAPSSSSSEESMFETSKQQ
jgi:hypothetical protein